MPKIDLKSCPFCGYEAELRHAGVNGFVVRCKNVRCMAEQAVYGDPITAAQMWNRRTLL